MSRPVELTPRDAIRSERIRRRMTIAEAAQAVGIDVKTFRRAERGGATRDRTLYRIAEYFRLDPVEILLEPTSNGHAPTAPGDEPAA